MIVLKFGGSVLLNKNDVDAVRSEIQRFQARGLKVAVVVSAFFGRTEELIDQAVEQDLHFDCVAYAELIASGEHDSARSLVENLENHNIEARCVTPAELDFVATGSRDAAVPQRINVGALHAALSESPVIVIPGFSAIDEQGDCVLLGRGGSDITAVCVAEALELDSVRLVKDVDGLYDRDPNKFRSARKLAHIDYQTAKEIGGELIQLEAIDFAASKNISIEIAAIGQQCGSRIGAYPTAVSVKALEQKSVA